MPKSAEIPLPAGWTEYKTENGTSYFHHDTLGTQWDRPTQTSKPGKDDGSAKSVGDEFLSSINSFFNPANSASSIEGNLRGDATPPKGFLSRAMSLHRYLQITTDEFKIRCTSTFTMISGLFQPGGPSQLQGAMFAEKPDFYGTLWITVLGAILLGFLPNLCNAVAVNKRTTFADYNSALFTFSFFPIAALASFAAGYTALQRKSPMGPVEEVMVSLPVLLCIAGYAELPVVLSLPILMINSWMFRLVIFSICITFSLGFIFVSLRGHNESFIMMPSPRKIQFMVFSIVLIIPYLSIMLKLPTYVPDVSATADLSGGLSKQVEDLISNDDSAVQAIAEAVQKLKDDAEAEVAVDDQDDGALNVEADAA